MSDSEFAKRMSQTPDPWTTAWWEKRYQEVLTAYRGASHGINRAQALYDEFISITGELRAKISELESLHKEDRAKIGELQARVERMASFLNSRRKNGEEIL